MHYLESQTRLKLTLKWKLIGHTVVTIRKWFHEFCSPNKNKKKRTSSLFNRDEHNSTKEWKLYTINTLNIERKKTEKGKKKKKREKKWTKYK